MATLGKIRDRAGLLVGVVGIALFAFIIGDFLKSGSTFFHQSKEKVAVVDGQSVNFQEYQTRIEETTEMYKKRNRNTPPSEEEQYQIRQSVFDDMVNTILLNKETEKVGITVEKEELSDMIMGNNISSIVLQMPDFQDPRTKAFDKNRLVQFLQTIETEDLSKYPQEAREQIVDAKKYWLFWEQIIKRERLQNKYSTLLSKAIVINSLDAKAAYEEAKVNVDMDFIVKPYASIPDTLITVTDSEISKLYNEKKNFFKQEDGKIIDYIAVDVIPSQTDFQQAEKSMSTIRSEFVSNAEVSDIVNRNSNSKFVDAFRAITSIDPVIRQFVEKGAVGDVEGPILNGNIYRMYKLVDKTTAPDSIKLNQIMLPDIKDEVALKTITDSLINLIKGGKSFTDMALEATQGETNGDMGWRTEADLVIAADTKFKDQVINAPLNEVLVVKSTHGSHLVQVMGRTKPVTKFKVADIQMPVTPSTETYSKIYNNLNQYISKNRTLETFKSAAIEAGYVCQQEITLNKNQPNLSGVAKSRPAVRWAFDHGKGDISDVFECEGSFVVVAVEGSLKKGIRPLTSVAEVLKRELINNKKAEKIIAELRAKNFTTVDQYAENMGISKQSIKYVSFATRNISGVGMEPVINAKAPLMEVGKISEPLKGNAGVYILGIVDKHVSESQLDLKVQKQALSVRNAEKYMHRLIPALKEKVKIEDNRIRFF